MKEECHKVWRVIDNKPVAEWIPAKQYEARNSPPYPVPRLMFDTHEKAAFYGLESRCSWLEDRIKFLTNRLYDMEAKLKTRRWWNR